MKLAVVSPFGDRASAAMAHGRAPPSAGPGVLHSSVTGAARSLRPDATRGLTQTVPSIFALGDLTGAAHNGTGMGAASSWGGHVPFPVHASALAGLYGPTTQPRQRHVPSSYDQYHRDEEQQQQQQQQRQHQNGGHVYDRRHARTESDGEGGGDESAPSPFLQRRGQERTLGRDGVDGDGQDDAAPHSERVPMPVNHMSMRGTIASSAPALYAVRSHQQQHQHQQQRYHPERAVGDGRADSDVAHRLEQRRNDHTVWTDSTARSVSRSPRSTRSAHASGDSDRSIARRGQRTDHGQYSAVAHGSPGSEGEANAIDRGRRQDGGHMQQRDERSHEQRAPRRHQRGRRARSSGRHHRRADAQTHTQRRSSSREDRESPQRQAEAGLTGRRAIHTKARTDRAPRQTHGRGGAMAADHDRAVADTARRPAPMDVRRGQSAHVDDRPHNQDGHSARVDDGHARDPHKGERRAPRLTARRSARAARGPDRSLERHRDKRENNYAPSTAKTSRALLEHGRSSADSDRTARPRGRRNDGARDRQGRPKCANPRGDPRDNEESDRTNGTRSFDDIATLSEYDKDDDDENDSRSNGGGDDGDDATPDTDTLYRSIVDNVFGQSGGPRYAAPTRPTEDAKEHAGSGVAPPNEPRGAPSADTFWTTRFTGSPPPPAYARRFSHDNGGGGDDDDEDDDGDIDATDREKGERAGGAGGASPPPDWGTIQAQALARSHETVLAEERQNAHALVTALVLLRQNMHEAWMRHATVPPSAVAQVQARARAFVRARCCSTWEPAIAPLTASFNTLIAQLRIDCPQQPTACFMALLDALVACVRTLLASDPAIRSADRIVALNADSGESPASTPRRVPESDRASSGSSDVALSTAVIVAVDSDAVEQGVVKENECDKTVHKGALDKEPTSPQSSECDTVPLPAHDEGKGKGDAPIPSGVSSDSILWNHIRSIQQHARTAAVETLPLPSPSTAPLSARPRPSLVPLTMVLAREPAPLANPQQQETPKEGAAPPPKQTP